MISYIPVSCFNYMIDEKNQKKGVGFVRVDEVLTFWWIKILVEIILTDHRSHRSVCLCVCQTHRQADRPVHAVTIAVQPLTLHVHQQNMHTSVMPGFVVESAWAYWPNFPQLARLVGDQQSSPPISPNWAYQSIHSLRVSIFLFPPSVPSLHSRTPECCDQRRSDVGAPFVFER